MYEQRNKYTAVKKLSGTAIVVIMGLWLVAPYAGKKSLAPVTHLQQVTIVEPTQPLQDRLSLPEGKSVLPPLPDFTYAAKVATPAVVYIQASQDPKILKREAITPLEQFFKQFFGEGLLIPKEYEQRPQVSTGSGVIYTSNGYIITNNHVVEGADQIEVTLHDNRRYKAKLVGSDPATDLAVLKIEASNLSILVLGSSDKLEVGEWVLAVGNPFNLYSTVTKGIVSAKSRHLNETSTKIGIQSFIQTDAAINPGNSGGALVNLYGELVGINTAIYATRSASFVGYGFAIPSSLVKKVADDFIQYGAVQRVLLGVAICDMNAELAKKLGLKITTGVYIDTVQDDSPCTKLFQKEDVIIQINSRSIHKCADLQEVIGCAKPGDQLTVILYRKGKEKRVNLLLEKAPDVIQVILKNNILKAEGATFQNIDEKTKAKYKLTGGVLVQEITKGKFKAAGLKKGYIVLAFDKQPVKGIVDFAEMIRSTKAEAVLIQVMEPNTGEVSYLAVEWAK
ncbi:Do family serine endopeptidase [Cardinium endosymbiont of Bemisia tabaci]|uniref:Do family serine endopeptidase n=1 Tax=Cardinium endosymbiont of Bemisia tabaci TaxID=672794 RepID=UPI000442D146|nr:Do family serine endopeptidase [Cardinium endosymbiont of Bemisia tabaci]CDG50046.1 Putative periplasmic serine endoprotease DegP [Cardinium endosymbiont cBtQ1 of Bemisia tabaci]